MSSRVYSVSQVNSYIKNLVSQDYMLRNISVSGEIGNCTYHRSGHIYFTLKDATAAVACVMWASSASKLSFRMKEGDRVVVTGSFDVYERDGRYQLLARAIELQGAGLLYEKFLQLKRELDDMGMTAQEYKRPIPSHVKRLGIVTAPTGKAIQDIRTVALRRNPYIQLILYPALVQGAGAKESIAEGIRTLDRLGLDCIIVGRGGGSIEDLWAFNERVVAEAIFQCHTPIISAVGHEPDVTISDFVADLRAATPSAAAELAVADVVSLLSKLNNAEHRIQFGMEYQLRKRRQALERYAQTWRHISPENKIKERRDQLQRLFEEFQREIDQLLQNGKESILRKKERFLTGASRLTERERHRLQLKSSRMEGLSPLAKLNQGYAKVSADDGTIIQSVMQLEQGEAVHIFVKDGRIDAEVNAVRRIERTDKA